MPKESDILKSCINRLGYWKLNKVCIHYQRLNSGNIRIGNRFIKMCAPGTPDLVAYIAVKAVCYVMFFECKRDLKSKQSALQKEFESKFEHYINVIYLVVTHPNQIDEVIEKITNFHKNQLDNMERHMGL